MTDPNLLFCLTLLHNARTDLKKALGRKKYRELMKLFWVYRYSDGSTEVHVNKGGELFPQGYFQTLQKTDNMYHAKAEGLMHIYSKLFEAEEKDKE